MCKENTYKILNTDKRKFHFVRLSHRDAEYILVLIHYFELVLEFYGIPSLYDRRRASLTSLQGGFARLFSTSLIRAWLGKISIFLIKSS